MDVDEPTVTQPRVAVLVDHPRVLRHLLHIPGLRRGRVERVQEGWKCYHHYVPLSNPPGEGRKVYERNITCVAVFRFQVCIFFSMLQYNPSHISQRSSYKNLSPYFPGSSHASAPAMKTSKLRELILPLPVLAGARTASTVSGSDSLNSLKPLRPPMRSGTTNSAFYFHPNTLRSMSSHSEMTRFSISDDHLAFGQMYGPPTPLSINAPAMNQQAAFQGLPPIQPLRSLNSMVGFSHSKTQSQSSVKSNGRRWSVRSEKLRPAPLRLSPAEGRLRECASGMRTVTVAEPREALMRGSVQVTVQRQQFYD